MANKSVLTVAKTSIILTDNHSGNVTGNLVARSLAKLPYFMHCNEYLPNSFMVRIANTARATFGSQVPLR